jgi:hypothetical protein
VATGQYWYAVPADGRSERARQGGARQRRPGSGTGGARRALLAGTVCLAFLARAGGGVVGSLATVTSLRRGLERSAADAEHVPSEPDARLGAPVARGGAGKRQGIMARRVDVRRRDAPVPADNTNRGSLAPAPRPAAQRRTAPRSAAAIVTRPIRPPGQTR